MFTSEFSTLKIGTKGDPIEMTFNNPINAYKAYLPFQQWLAGEGSFLSSYIYNVDGPGEPIPWDPDDWIFLTPEYKWSDGSDGYYESSTNLIYENKKIISCAYKSKILATSGGFDVHSHLRSIITEFKKRAGFLEFEAWMSNIQINAGIPLGFGGKKSVRIFWDWDLDAEWGD